jgi:hypothetical protein
VLARLEIVVWSGTPPSKPSSVNRDRRKPSVWCKRRWKTIVNERRAQYVAGPDDVPGLERVCHWVVRSRLQLWMGYGVGLQSLLSALASWVGCSSSPIPRRLQVPARSVTGARRFAPLCLPPVHTMKRDRFLVIGVAAAVWTAGCGGQSKAELETKSEPSSSSSAAADAGAKPSVVTEGLSCDIPSAPCGGNVVGTWTVMACPLELTGQVDVLALGLGCGSGTISSGALEVSGTWIADAMGNVWDDTTTRGAQKFELPAACLEVLLVTHCASIAAPLKRSLGYDTVECVDNPETGGCTCTGTFDQKGGLAAISSGPLEAGSYVVAGTTLTTGSGGNETTYGHCATDNVMVLTLPVPGSVGQVVGSIVLHK